MLRLRQLRRTVMILGVPGEVRRMEEYRSLLVGVDFTPCSAAALRQAMRLATGFETDLNAVHVIDTLVAIELEEALSDLQRNIRDGLLSDARRAWLEFAAQVPGTKEIPFDVTINSRLVGIIQEACKFKTDLLILGAFGHQPPDVGLGTVASACVRGAPSDVLLVRDTQHGPFKTIVAAVDFSETSAHALRRAAHFTKLDDAQLHVLHVFDPPWHRLHYRAPTVEVAPQFVKQYSAALLRQLQEFARSQLSTFPSVKSQCRLFDHGAHRSSIVEYATQAGADLIAIGTRGRANIRDMILGSTAEKVLKLSTCSVLVVKPVETPAK